MLAIYLGNFIHFNKLKNGREFLANFNRMDKVVEHGKGFPSLSARKEMLTLIQEYAKLLSEEILIEESNAIFNEKIESLELPTRAKFGLLAENIAHVGQLVQMSENDILRIPGLGRVSFTQIQNTLERSGLRLGMEINNWEIPR